MKIMNRLVMVVWGLIICALCTIILMIGYKQKDNNKELLNLQSNLKEATKLYIKDHNIKLGVSESTKIYIEDLVNEKYISEDDEEIDKYCVDSVVYSNGIIKDSFKINSECEE